MADKIKIYLVDDHQMLLDGLKAIISSEKDFEIVGECTLPLLAFEQIQLLKPDIVLTDINMPELSGIDLVRKLKPRMNDTKFIALSMYGERSYIKDMLQAGVKGYILKNTGREELVRAIKTVYEGNEFFSEEVENVIESNPVNDEKINTINLTEREVDIIDCIAKEMTNAQIADALFISERTVETHRKNIFRKTGIKGVVGLVKFALDKGFIK
ncbi:MAG: response regulator transcription factor [Bacteroidetes bacterium]|nr:response regulator transcription factor [Bacteroidota bacterium]